MYIKDIIGQCTVAQRITPFIYKNEAKSFFHGFLDSTGENFNPSGLKLRMNPILWFYDSGNGGKYIYIVGSDTVYKMPENRCEFLCLQQRPRWNKVLMTIESSNFKLLFKRHEKHGLIPVKLIDLDAVVPEQHFNKKNLPSWEQIKQTHHIACKTKSKNVM